MARPAKKAAADTAVEKPAAPETPENAKAAEEVGDPLASPAGRAWLAAELETAEAEEKHGPGGRGWCYNETKRGEIAERAGFLRALAALLS